MLLHSNNYFTLNSLFDSLSATTDLLAAADEQKRLLSFLLMKNQNIINLNLTSIHTLTAYNDNIKGVISNINNVASISNTLGRLEDKINRLNELQEEVDKLIDKNHLISSQIELDKLLNQVIKGDNKEILGRMEKVSEGAACDLMSFSQQLQLVKSAQQQLMQQETQLIQKLEMLEEVESEVSVEDYLHELEENCRCSSNETASLSLRLDQCNHWKSLIHKERLPPLLNTKQRAVSERGSLASAKAKKSAKIAELSNKTETRQRKLGIMLRGCAACERQLKSLQMSEQKQNDVLSDMTAQIQRGRKQVQQTLTRLSINQSIRAQLQSKLLPQLNQCLLDCSVFDQELCASVHELTQRPSREAAELCAALQPHQVQQWIIQEKNRKIQQSSKSPRRLAAYRATVMRIYCSRTSSVQQLEQLCNELKQRSHSLKAMQALANPMQQMIKQAAELKGISLVAEQLNSLPALKRAVKELCAEEQKHQLPPACSANALFQPDSIRVLMQAQMSRHQKKLDKKDLAAAQQVKAAQHRDWTAHKEIYDLLQALSNPCKEAADKGGKATREQGDSLSEVEDERVVPNRQRANFISIDEEAIGK
jgi:hypothetical protein